MSLPYAEHKGKVRILLMLSNWKKRGYIELDETTDEYIKIKGIVVGGKRGSQIVR